MIVRLALLVTLEVLVGRVASSYAQTHRRRRQARPQALPEPLQTWESEGGGTVCGPSTAERAAGRGGLADDDDDGRDEAATGRSGRHAGA